MARGDYLARTQGGTTNTTNTTNTKGGGGSKGGIDLGGLFSSIGSIFGGNKQEKIPRGTKHSSIRKVFTLQQSRSCRKCRI